METTAIQYLGEEQNNYLYIKREDLIPYSFGGNKVRKAILFFNEIDKGNFDCVVTYGSSSSNHCRVISNMACSRGMKCYIISPKEVSKQTFNSQMMEIFGAEIITVPVEQVHDTIEEKLRELHVEGKKPYFIAGGGHSNIGTQAYVNCYEEIRAYEEKLEICFDYIFHASGTGTTQAGLICGQLKHKDNRKIIGISIARKNPRGRQIVVDSVRDYLGDVEGIEEATIFDDSYIGAGYGKGSTDQTIYEVLRKYGIPLDSTYTGKAFYGMQGYIKEHDIKGQNILFIHTGGTPLFFDGIKKEWENEYFNS